MQSEIKSLLRNRLQPLCIQIYYADNENLCLKKLSHTNILLTFFATFKLAPLFNRLTTLKIIPLFNFCLIFNHDIFHSHCV